MKLGNDIFCGDRTVAVEEIPELKIAKHDKSDKVLEATIKTQTIEFFEHRDYVEKYLQSCHWIQLLTVNAQKIPQNNQEVCICKFHSL